MPVALAPGGLAAARVAHRIGRRPVPRWGRAAEGLPRRDLDQGRRGSTGSACASAASLLFSLWPNRSLLGQSADNVFRDRNKNESTASIPLIVTSYIQGEKTHCKGRAREWDV